MQLLLLPKIKNYYPVILIFVIANHGLLLLNDGVYWDGWLIYSYLSEKRYDLLQQMFLEAGSPIGFIFHRMMGYFPNIVFGYKLVAFLSIIFIGIFIYKILAKLFIFSELEALIVALVAISYPAFQVHFELIIVPYDFLYACFLLGLLIAINCINQGTSNKGYQKNQKKNKIYFVRLLSLLILFISFATKSLLVFYFGFLLIILLFKQFDLQKNQTRLFLIKNKILNFVKYYPDFILLPFIFLFITNTLFPVHGLYYNYNKINLSWQTFQKVIENFVQQSVVIQMSNSFKEVLERPIIYLILAIIVFLYQKKILKTNPVDNNNFNYKSLCIKFIFGIILFFLAIFPYAAVGKYPSSTGWNTRMALLLALPIGIIVASLISLVCRNKRVSRITLTLLSVILLSFTSLNIQNYITWQARWITDRSIIVNLAKIQDAKQFSIFWIDYNLPFFRQYGQHYSFYEWSSIFKQAWGDESRVGYHKEFSPALILRHQRQGLFTERYNASDFDPLGKQACLIIDSGVDKYSYNQLFIGYFFNKILGKNYLDIFLEKVTYLKLVPLNKCKQ